MAESTFDIFPASKSTQKTMKLKHLILLVLSIDCLTNLYLFYFKQLFYDKKSFSNTHHEKQSKFITLIKVIEKINQNIFLL